MKIRILFAVAVFGYLSACASVKTLPEDYQAPIPLPREYLTEFCYQPSTITEELTLVKEKKKYRLYEVSIDAGLNGFDDDSLITFDYYEQLKRDRVAYCAAAANPQRTKASDAAIRDTVCQ